FPRVQCADVLHPLAKLGIAWHRRRQPQMLAPRFEFVAGQDPLHRLRRDRIHHTVGNQLAGQLRTVPVRQRPSYIIRPFASNLDQMNRDFGGKRPAVGRSVSHHRALQCPVAENARSIYKDAAVADRPTARSPRRSAPRQATAWPALVWPIPLQYWSVVTNRATRRVAPCLKKLSSWLRDSAWQHPCSPKTKGNPVSSR